MTATRMKEREEMAVLPSRDKSSHLWITVTTCQFAHAKTTVRVSDGKRFVSFRKRSPGFMQSRDIPWGGARRFREINSISWNCLPANVVSRNGSGISLATPWVVYRWKRREEIYIKLYRKLYDFGLQPDLDQILNSNREYYIRIVNLFEVIKNGSANYIYNTYQYYIIILFIIIMYVYTYIIII